MSQEPKLMSDWMTYDKILPQVKPGDLIEIQRLNLFFKLLCVSKNFVSTYSFIFFFQHWAVAVECEPKDCFVVNLTDDSIVHRERLSQITFGKNCRINNSLDYWFPPLAQEEIVQRAIGSVGESRRPYNFTEYNCEHFAKECRNGQALSYQVMSAGSFLTPGNFIRRSVNFSSSIVGKVTGEEPKRTF